MRDHSMSNYHQDRDAGQMLLATGVVLLMSLLSMAIFGVKVAGLTMPHDTASDGVLVTSTEVVSAVPEPVSYTHLRAHETEADLVCRLLLEKKKK